ncbi:LOW QUALITY PROTEIN: hypothetical protein QTO34_005250, partial [Cnephaeus nilssonii]
MADPSRSRRLGWRIRERDFFSKESPAAEAGAPGAEDHVTAASESVPGPGAETHRHEALVTPHPELFPGAAGEQGKHQLTENPSVSKTILNNLDAIGSRNGTADLAPTKQHSVSPKWDMGPTTTPERHPTKSKPTLRRPHGTKCGPQLSPAWKQWLRVPVRDPSADILLAVWDLPALLASREPGFLLSVFPLWERTDHQGAAPALSVCSLVTKSYVGAHQNVSGFAAILDGTAHGVRDRAPQSEVTPGDDSIFDGRRLSTEDKMTGVSQSQGRGWPLRAGSVCGLAECLLRCHGDEASIPPWPRRASGQRAQSGQQGGTVAPFSGRGPSKVGELGAWCTSGQAPSSTVKSESVPSKSLRRCGGFRKALRLSRQAARSPALAFDRGGPVRLAVRRCPRPSESLRRCGGFRKALRRSRQAARSPALAFDRGGPVRLAVRRRPRPSESLRRCGGFRKALRRSRQAARSPALAFDRGGPVRLAVRRRPRPSESLRRCGGFRKALRRSRQAARSPALAFDRGGPVRLAVRRRPRPSESLRRCGGFRKALRRSRQAARSPALAFDRGGPVRLAAPQAFRKPPAAMVQTLSSRRQRRRELSVLLAQSATPATLSPAPCASCWPNRGRSGVM